MSTEVKKSRKLERLATWSLYGLTGYMAIKGIQVMNRMQEVVTKMEDDINKMEEELEDELARQGQSTLSHPTGTGWPGVRV